MEKIKKFFGGDCHVVPMILSGLLAMTLLCACDGDGTNQDADTCCDADVPTDQDGGEVEHCAALEVSSIPAGAAIELDSEPTGEVTPHTFTDVSVGLHTFLLSLDGYDAAPEEVNVTTECAPVNVTLYPSVEGEWDLTYRNSETGAEGHYTLDLEQTGDLLIGWDDVCDYTGSILATGEMSLFRSNCGGITRTVTGNLINTNRMEGNWYSGPESSGTWWADRR